LRINCPLCDAPIRERFFVCLTCWTRVTTAQQNRALCLRYDADLPCANARFYLWSLQAKHGFVNASRFQYAIYQVAARLNPAFDLWLLEEPDFFPARRPPRPNSHYCQWYPVRPHPFDIGRLEVNYTNPIIINGAVLPKP